MALKNYPTHELLSELLRRDGINAREYTKTVGQLIDIWEMDQTSINCPSKMTDLFDKLISILEDVS